MKKFYGVAFALLLVLMGQSLPVLAANSRHGVVMEIVPIENKGTDESEQVKSRRKLGAKLGSLIGPLAGMVASKANNDVATGAAYVAAENGGQIGSEVAARAGDKGPTTRYVVKVKLDAGKTLTITQLHEQVEGLKPGSRVRVEGKGDSALVFAE